MRPHQAIHIQHKWPTSFPHAAAPLQSIFFFLARQTEGTVVNWLSGARTAFADGSVMDDTSPLGKYIFSLYWSAVTFATVG